MKKGAMELSVGTIVTIVLAVIMLGVGIYIITLIRGGATNAIDSINDEVITSIRNAFADEDKVIVVYPTTRTIKISRGDTGKGFAFGIQNTDLKEHAFKWTVAVDQYFDAQTKCGVGLADISEWIVNPQGGFTLGGSQKQVDPLLVKFNIPKNANKCQIPFNIEVRDESAYYTGSQVFLDLR